MRVEGYDIPMSAKAAADGFDGGRRLDHPFAALALILALSGSPTYAMGDDNGIVYTAEGPVESGGDRAAAEGMGRRYDDRDEAGGDVGDLLGDSSKLWSTDSEEEAEEEEEVGGGNGEGAGAYVDDIVGRVPLQSGGGPAVRREAGDGDDDEEGEGETTQQWLQAFQDELDEEATSGEDSAHTDGECTSTNVNCFRSTDHDIFRHVARLKRQYAMTHLLESHACSQFEPLRRS